MDPKLIASVLVPMTVLLIPVIAILTRHQLRMAELIHGKGQNQVPLGQNDNGQLREEVRQLRELMHQQSITLDNLRNELRSTNTVQDRINQNS